MKIFGSHRYDHLGDSWRIVSLAVRQAQCRRPVTGVGSSETRLRTRYQEILDLLEHGESLSVFDYFTHETEVNRCVPIVRTKIKWNETGSSRRFCYQLDGIFNSHSKNPETMEVETFFSKVPAAKALRLGRNLSLRECVAIAAHSDFFVGVDSGFAQVCYSIGVPVILLTYSQAARLIKVWHGRRPFQIYKTLSEMSFTCSRLQDLLKDCP